MIVRIINGVFIGLAVFMGLKQGMAMVAGKPEMLAMFAKWGFSRWGVLVNGVLTIASALLVLFPRTFLAGNFLMAALILLIICFHLSDGDWKGVMVELPFFLLNWVIIYLKYPLGAR